MKILIVSDNHGRTGNLERVIREQGRLDYFLHLGDTEGSEDEIEAMLDCPYVIVAGNNDYFSALPDEKVLKIGRYKIWMTHGHQYGVYMGTARLEREMARRGVDIAMIGHTHVPMIKPCGSRMILNPGSISYPRQSGRRPSYMLMEIDREGEAHYTICYL